MVRQKLERHDRQERLNDLGRIGDRQEHVGQAAQGWSPSVPTVMIVPLRALTSSRLLSVLACNDPRGATKTHGRLAIDECDRPVFHLGRRIAFGVNIADLLELERPLERDRKVKVSAEERARFARRRTARRPVRSRARS